MAEVTYKSNAAAILAALDESAFAGVTKLTDSICDEASEGCPVGSVTRGGYSWKERTPGLLRSTIFSRVRVMKDGTDDVVGWVKAGTQGASDNRSAFYAPFVEFGTQKWPGGNPFMRPAFRHHSADELLDIVAFEFSSVRRTGVKR
jgi:hypothetical protein